MGRIMTSDLSSNLVIQSDCKNGGLFGQNFLRNDVAQRHIDSEQRQINGTAYLCVFLIIPAFEIVGNLIHRAALLKWLSQNHDNDYSDLTMP